MSVLTIPNLLTLSRMVLTVFFFSAGLQNEWLWAMIIFIAAALTDMVDGAIARLLHQQSDLGAIIDPMADKLMMLGGVSLLTIQGVLPWWLMALIVGRDLYITFGFFYLWQRQVAIKWKPTILSKLTTLSQILVISFGFVAVTNASGFALPQWMIPFASALPATIVVVASLTVVTAIQYTVIGVRLLQGYESAATDK